MAKMDNIDQILKSAEAYEQACLLKEGKIRKLPNGKYRVLSENGKNLGTYTSREGAKKRLKQVEYFKHVNNADDVNDGADVNDVIIGSNLSKCSNLLGVIL